MVWFDIPDILLPPVYRAIKDMYAYARSLDTELREFIVYMNDIRTNFFIQTCDEDTLKEWENTLGISGYAGESIEDRRKFVMLYLNNRYPTTEPFIRGVMANMFGSENYTLEFDQFDPFQLNLHVYDTNYDKIQKFFTWFAKMCPAHIRWANYHTENSQATNYIEAHAESHVTATSSSSLSVGTGVIYLGNTAYTADWLEV